MTVLRGRVLGAFGLDVDGRPIERSAFERPSGVRLLKLLLATPGHAVGREEAAEMLWPESDPDRSGANLRKALHFARAALEAAGLPAEAIESAGDRLRIRSGPVAGTTLELAVDVDDLRDALAAVAPAGPRRAHDAAAVEPAALERLADLSGAELLPEDPYEEWLVPLRERLRQQGLAGLLDGARAARAQGRLALALRLAERALAIDPADETAHRLAIELHLDAGELHAARRQLLEAARALADAYGIQPSPDLVALVAEATAARAGVAPAASEPPIVGRHRELEAADAALDAVGAGRLGIAVFRGPAGMGKTRILRELRRLAGSSGWRVVEIRGRESSPDLAFAAIGGGLAALLGADGPSSLAEPGRSAMLTVSPTRPERPGIVFASDEALVDALLTALDAVAAQGPLVLAIDDLQWLDPGTIDLIARTTTRLRQRPVLVLATIRDAPDALPPPAARFLAGVDEAGGTVVELGALATREIRAILERDLPGGRLDDALAAEIAERVGGAPLFALEVLRGAIESGAVAERAGTWRRVAANAALPVPGGVARMVEARTAQLPVAVRHILTIAAELGDEVTIERLVAAVSPPATGSATGLLDASPVLSALDAAIRGGLMVERAAGYAFAHPLFRSSLRAVVPPGERAELHARVALALAGPIDPRDAPGIEAAADAGVDVVAVAEHALAAAELGRADAVPRAIGFGVIAGRREAARFDHVGSIRTLTRALRLAERLGDADRPAFPLAAGYLQLGWSRHATREEAAATAAFRRSAALATTDAERAAAWQAAAWMPYEHGRFDTADAILREALQTVADPVARAGIESDRAWIIGRKGDWRTAYEILAPAVEAMQAGAPAVLLARSLDRLGVAMRDAVDVEASIPILERALRLATEVGDARLAATVRMHLAGAFRAAGRHAAAGAQIDAALATCAMTGDRYIEAVTVWIAADIAHARGDLREAVELRRRELVLLDGLGGNEHNQAMAHAHLAFLARALGDPETAATEAEIARTIARHSGLDHLPARVDYALASEGWFIEDAPSRGGGGLRGTPSDARRPPNGTSAADAGLAP